MKVTKRKLDEIRHCYCAASIHMKYEDHTAYTSEDPDVIYEMFSGRSFKHKRTIRKKAGGRMSIIPISNRKRGFLAVQEFCLKVSPSLSKIVWGKYTGDGFIIKDVLQLPHIHRSDIYHRNGVNYFIDTTIVTTEQNKKDWSVPGRIYVGELSEDLNEGIQIEVLMGGLYHSHDYYRDAQHTCGYFGSDQEIVEVTPPAYRGGQWQVGYVPSGTIGEIAVLDIDGSEEQEIMTIEPFHGTEIRIYKKLEGSYQRIYTYESGIDSAHTLIGGTLRGVPTFLADARRRDAELFYVQYKDGAFVTKGIDHGVGPANLCLVSEKDHDLTVAVNHTVSEAAAYVVEDWEIYDAGRTEKEGARSKSTVSQVWTDYLYMGRCIGG